jgi:glycosyltransferase involved in cell wall biosynthesis
MKILMLADVFFPDTIGGAGRVLYHLSVELNKKGHEVHILTRKPDSKLPTHQELDTNIFVHRFPTPRNESLASFLSEIKNSYFLANELTKKIAFELICIHQSQVAAGPLLSNRLRQIPIVYYFHSPWHEEFLIKKQKNNGKITKSAQILALLMRRMEQRILFMAKKVIVLSQYMSDKVLEVHQYPGSRIIKIPGGVDTNRFQMTNGGKAASKGTVKLPLEKTIFLTVRNLVPRMGIENLIEAFNRSETLRQKVLLLIGGDGFLENHLRSMVENYALQDSIRFLGHILEKDLPQMYQAADFFILPTKELEGFGLVILEAMASGTPVLGTPVGAIPEVIGLFDNRLIFDGTGWQDMKKKLEEVIERPDKYHFDQMGCREFVEKNFTWRIVADTFEREVMH